MSVDLPRLLALYLSAANAHDVAAMSAAFSADSIVKDEGREHRGLAAIREWMKETIEKYDYKVEPIAWSQRDRGTVVRVSIRGTFPGSPITLQYEFTIEGRKIARLEIGR